jgi:uncharacterized protein involved in exopolysaccharide biosynthesis
MAENFHIATRRPHSPTLRDVADVLFRHKKLLLVAFCLAFAAGIIGTVISPTYQAEMKILLRRGRIDPVITPTQTSSPAFEHDQISEEEMNSEVELLHDEDILRPVVLRTGLANHSWWSRLGPSSEETRTQKAVRRLTSKLDIQPVHKSRLIRISYRSSDPRMSAAVHARALHGRVKKLSGQEPSH